MREILRNPVSAVISINEFSCQHHSPYPVICRHLRFRQCINVNSILKQNKWCATKQELNWTSVLLPKILKLSLVVRSTKADDSPILSNMIANFETGLVCGEEEGEDRFEESFMELKSPPWGDLPFHKDSNFEPKDTNKHNSSSEGVVSVDENPLHFLEQTDEHILSKRILVLSRTNRVRSAWELFRSMEVMGLIPNLHACNSLLSCLLRNGRLNDGLKFFEFMKIRKLFSGHACSLLLKSVANAQGYSSALELFGKWERECEMKKGFDAVVYNTMISICGKVNNWVETERLWRLMKESRCKETRITYCLLVSTFVRSGQIELALDAYREMVRNQFEPRNDTMQAIIGACTREGKWDFALSVFRDMLRCEFQPSRISCNALINALGKAGKVKLAFWVYDIMKSLGHLPDVYTWNALLCALYRANRHDDALELFESIKRDENTQLNLHLYNTILMSCSKLGFWDRAVEILWQMEASGQSFSVSSYNLVINACEIARKPDIALQVYKHMIHQKHMPDVFTHLSIIRCCIWGSLWDEVDGILDRAEPNVSLYNAVIQGMCLRGNINSAKKLYGKMRENGLQPDGKTRALMLQNLPKDRVRQKKRWSSSSRKRYKPVLLHVGREANEGIS